MTYFPATSLKGFLYGAAFACLGAMATVSPAQARDHGYHRGYHGYHDGYYGHRGVDVDIWLGGGWRHDWYGGRYGWWWVVGPDWYYYPRPIYPYPDYNVTVVQPPPAAPSAPQAQYWYYCDNPKGYYPYVQQCPSAWRAVPATPPGPVR